MMLLCAVPPHTHSNILLTFHCFSYSSNSKSKAPPIFYSNHSSRSSDTAFTFTRPNVHTNPSSPSPSPVHQSSTNGNSSTPDEQDLVPSAALIAATICRSSASPVEIVQRIARDGNDGLVLPSPTSAGSALSSWIFQMIK